MHPALFWGAKPDQSVRLKNSHFFCSVFCGLPAFGKSDSVCLPGCRYTLYDRGTIVNFNFHRNGQAVMLSFSRISKDYCKAAGLDWLALSTVYLSYVVRGVEFQRRLVVLRSKNGRTTFEIDGIAPFKVRRTITVSQNAEFGIGHNGKLIATVWTYGYTKGEGFNTQHVRISIQADQSVTILRGDFQG